MIDWLDEFYSSPETQKLLEESFAPLFAEYGAAVAAVAGAEVGSTPAVAPFIEAIASTYISNYLSSSRAQMQEMLSAPDPRAAIEGRLAEWAEKRPGKVAQEATVQTSNAVTQTVYKDAGVTRKRWNARGKSCPYCRRMNGKVVGIDRPFHKEGDSIEVPDSEISAKAKLNFTHEIGHPPQHQGCDCVIEADMQTVLPGFDAPEVPVGLRQFNTSQEADAYMKGVYGDVGDRLERKGMTGRYADLSTEELNALQSYSGTSYGTVNSYLRKGLDPELDIGPGARFDSEADLLDTAVKPLDSALARNRLPSPVVATRGLSLEEGSPWAGFNDGDDLTGLLGQSFEEKGYLSTSIGPTTRPSYPIQMNITVPSGTGAMYMEPITKISGEYELLLARGQTYTITGVRNIGPNLDPDVFAIWGDTDQWVLDAKILPS